METVFAEAVLRGFGGGDHVSSRWGGDGGVEGGVEEGDIGGFGDGGMDCFDDFEGAGVVQGGESGERFEVVVGVGVDAGGFGVGTAVDDAVASKRDVVGVFELGEVRVGGEVGENCFEGVLGVGDVVEGLVFGDCGGATRVGQGNWRGG